MINYPCEQPPETSQLEHFDLEDAFGRRPQPVLVAAIELRPRPGDDPHEAVQFTLSNEGRGIARYVGLMCAFAPDVAVVSVDRGWSNNTNINQGRPVVSYTDNLGVIHAVAILHNLGGVTIRRPTKGMPLTVSVRWYCEGMFERSFDGVVAVEDAGPAAHSEISDAPSETAGELSPGESRSEN